MVSHTDDICTSRFVESCTDKVDCQGFQPDAVEDEFHKLYDNAYAQVCEEKSTGENCIYTDVVFKECGTAKGAESTN